MSANVFKVELSMETDGRWIADIPSLPGVLAYGDSQEKAIEKANANALAVLVVSVKQNGKTTL